MVTTFGSFPGVRVETAGGGITAVTIGEEEKLVLFGGANYGNEGAFTTTGATDPIDGEAVAEEPVQINARREADTFFGEGSQLADAMRGALSNGANINFLFAVAPKRVNVVEEIQTSQSGDLDNAPIYEENVSDEGQIENIVVNDSGDEATYDVVFRYDGAPASPDAADTVAINPLTGEYAADDAPTGDFEFSYKYLNWGSAFDAQAVEQTINENETGIFSALSDSDAVSDSLQGTVATMRGNYQLVNALTGSEPNDQEIVTVDGEDLAEDFSNYQRADAKYDTGDYENANQSIDEDYYFKFAPVRNRNEKTTVVGEIGGLFAGNAISDPIYNEPLSGITSLEQQFTRTDANNIRDNNVIPIRQNGSIRVKDNLSTSTETDWERDFWRRRIADRVILIAKQIGESIIGRINDDETRESAERLISAELRQLVNDRLLRANTEDQNYWFVDVYEDATDPDQVNIDIGFTPLGIVKRVDVSITINA